MWTEAIPGKKKLQIQISLDTCGGALVQYFFISKKSVWKGLPVIFEFVFLHILGYNKCHGSRCQRDGFAKYDYEKGNMHEIVDCENMKIELLSTMPL